MVPVQAIRGRAATESSSNGELTRARSAAFRFTTNQRMELSGCIAGLKALKRSCSVIVVTDSLYVVKGMQEWVHNWKKRGWKRPGNKPVDNLDLWQELYALSQTHSAEFRWVKGHNGHPENERADELARQAIKDGAEAPDEGYEATRNR